MIDPGSVGDWLQASLMAAALGGLAVAGRRALRNEEADQGTPQAVPPQAVPPRASIGALARPGRAHTSGAPGP